MVFSAGPHELDLSVLTSFKIKKEEIKLSDSCFYLLLRLQTLCIFLPRLYQVHLNFRLRFMNLGVCESK